MTQPKLSILIPTVVGREESLDKLINSLDWVYVVEPIFEYEENGLLFTEYGGGESTVQILIAKDNKEITIGEKREQLYNLAKGVYSIQVDDDDELAPNAIEIILKAIEENPDVDAVTFEENCQMNGKYYKSNHSLKYPDWYGDGSNLLHDGFHYHRTPFYKSVIKTSIAQSVPFKHIRYGEDHQWAIDLYPHLETEIHIDRELYFYIYEPKDTHEERYGINR